jgi:hypothetical protein
VIVSGMVAADPMQGGAAWAVLQYVLGLQRLGCDVLLVEQCKPEALQPSGAPVDRSDNASYFNDVIESFGLERSASLLVAGRRETAGLPYGELQAWAREADVLLNISGILDDEELAGPVPVRVYLDLDPAFAQLWHDEGIDMGFDRHTHFATVGLSIGSPDCTVPTCGRKWIKTVPPVVFEHWPVSRAIETDALTTVANWRGYGSVERHGVHYGQKVHSLRNFIELPRLTDMRFALALNIHRDEKRDLEALSENGWELLDSATVAGTPDRYGQFLRGSRAEFGIAKSGYVLSRSGWFSDRSACYLASGRPVIAQDTGFSAHLPVGEGLFDFATSADVLAAIEELERDYDRHAGAARALAQEHFDSDAVLSRLLERLGASGAQQ